MANRNNNRNATQEASAQELSSIKHPDVVNEDAIGAAIDAVDMAVVAASWANDRITPVLQALVALADISSVPGNLVASRVSLIRDMAKLGVGIADEMAADFESSGRALHEKLAALKAGAA